MQSACLRDAAFPATLTSLDGFTLCNKKFGYPSSGDLGRVSSLESGGDLCIAFEIDRNFVASRNLPIAHQCGPPCLNRNLRL